MEVKSTIQECQICLLRSPPEKVKLLRPKWSAFYGLIHIYVRARVMHFTLGRNSIKTCGVWLGLSPFAVIVTTRISTFLVGDPNRPSFATTTGKGDNPNYDIDFFHLNSDPRKQCIFWFEQVLPVRHLLQSFHASHHKSVMSCRFVSWLLVSVWFRRVNKESTWISNPEIEHRYEKDSQCLKGA